MTSDAIDDDHSTPRAKDELARRKPTAKLAAKFGEVNKPARR